MTGASTGCGKRGAGYHDCSVVIIMQKRGRRALGPETSRFLNLEQRVKQLPVLAEVVYEPGRGECHTKNVNFDTARIQK
jgi:hypothetical protein